MSALHLYAQTHALTQRMLAAAQNQNWDELIALGAEREKIVARLPERLPPLLEAEGKQLADLIREILSAHTEIAAHAGPWLKDVRRLLQAFDGEATQGMAPLDASR